MPESSTQSIVVAASPDKIMAVIADIEAYPEWAKAVGRVEILERDRRGNARLARFTLDSGQMQDEYTLAYKWERDGLKVSWRLVKGQVQKAQEGEYVLRPLAGGDRTEVTYTLSVELTLPMIGKLRRKAEKVIMDTALKELKRRVEARS